MATITGYNKLECIDENGVLTIPAKVHDLDTGITYDVIGIGFQAFLYNDTIKSVEFESGSKVTTIGESAFEYCTELTSIDLPDGLTSIGDGAFSSCESLTSITISASVTSIGNHAFYGCAGLTSIILPDGLDSIGGVAFADCTGLTSITIPAGVTTIGNFAFARCTSLTSITLLSSNVGIGQNAFPSTSGLNIFIPNGTGGIEFDDNFIMGMNGDNVTFWIMNGDTKSEGIVNSLSWRQGTSPRIVKMGTEDDAESIRLTATLTEGYKVPQTITYAPANAFFEGEVTNDTIHPISLLIGGGKIIVPPGLLKGTYGFDLSERRADWFWDGTNLKAESSTAIATLTINVNRPITSLTGLTLTPVAGKAPVTSIPVNDQYTGTGTDPIKWDPMIPEGGKFDYGKAYTATLTLTAVGGYTFLEVNADSFTINGAKPSDFINNNPTSDSVTIKAKFEPTAKPDITLNLTPKTASVPQGGTLVFAASASGRDYQMSEFALNWSITGNRSNETYIYGEGLTNGIHFALGELFVGANETATELTVKVEFDKYPGISVTATVTVTEKQPEPPAPPTLSIPSYTVNVTIEPEGAGEVEGLKTSYSRGTSCEIKAVPSVGHVFVGWYDDDELLSNEAELKFDVNGNRNLVAKFAKIGLPEQMLLTVGFAEQLIDRAAMPNAVIRMTPENAPKFVELDEAAGTLKGLKATKSGSAAIVTVTNGEDIYTVRVEVAPNQIIWNKPLHIPEKPAAYSSTYRLFYNVKGYLRADVYLLNTTDADITGAENLRLQIHSDGVLIYERALEDWKRSTPLRNMKYTYGRYHITEAQLAGTKKKDLKLTTGKIRATVVGMINGEPIIPLHEGEEAEATKALDPGDTLWVTEG